MKKTRGSVGKMWHFPWLRPPAFDDKRAAGALERSDSIAANAATGIAEIRATIDHQVKAASDLDTKLAALITGLGTAAGFAASRLTLDGTSKEISFAASALLVAATILFAIFGLRPRAASFGVDPGAITAMVGGSTDQFRQSLLNGLAKAYGDNYDELKTKATNYERALLAFFATLISIGPLIATGAVH
jgi:hypothetical protein